MKRVPMRMRTQQRGMLLLSVSVMLAILGALAYAMARDSAMGAQGVEAQYDSAKARYLAETGLNMARWYAQRAGCKSTPNVAATTLPGIGTFSAQVGKGKAKTLNIVATGMTVAGAVSALTRSNVTVHDLSAPKSVSLKADAGNDDTYLSIDMPTAVLGGTSYLELTNGRNTALLQFSLKSVPAGASVIQADLKLNQFQTAASTPGQSVSVHRVTSAWNSPAATWQTAQPAQLWKTAGGDYTAANVATANVGAVPGTTTWDIAALLDGWVNGVFPNNGLLLRPDGPLQQMRFASRTNTSYAVPTVDVVFYPPC